MDGLILEDFRCFAGRREVELAPITLLVGENSSGKSSFLAAARLAWDLSTVNDPDFNEEPFLLGSYDQIANHRGGSAPRSACFTLGVTFSSNRRGPRPISSYEGTFTATDGQPALASRRLRAQGVELAISFDSNDVPVIEAITPSGTFPIEAEGLRLGRSAALRRLPSWQEARFALSTHRAREQAAFSGLKLPQDQWARVIEMLEDTIPRRSAIRPYAFAPIRSSPKRTYDPMKDTRDAEGQHIPMVLSRALASEARTTRGLRSDLQEFGLASGLFSDIQVKKLGKGVTPFQLQVKTSGPLRNLIDVGYGVSQVLPLLVELLSSASGSTFLVQQPEVHLHPRAQAALASLMATLVRAGRIQLLVETHSDYIIDRLRFLVKERELASSLVRILYFERLKSKGTIIHEIPLDPMGNLVNVPDSYRAFFLEEQERIF